MTNTTDPLDDILDEFSEGIEMIDFEGDMNKIIADKNQLFEEAKAAIKQHYLELADSCKSNWGNGKDLIDPDELRKKIENE